MTQLLAQTRLKTFDIPHKGLRNLLAQVTMLAGTTDFSNKAQVTHLHHLGRDLFQLLTEHARDENEIVLAALNQRQPGAGMHNEAEHEEIEKQQAQLEQMLETLVAKARKDGDVGYLAEQFFFEMNRFQSGYLLHMLEEEEETQRLLWKYFSDAGIAGDAQTNYRSYVAGHTIAVVSFFGPLHESCRPFTMAESRESRRTRAVFYTNPGNTGDGAVRGGF
jgi:hypothetical protein